MGCGTTTEVCTEDVASVNVVGVAAVGQRAGAVAADEATGWPRRKSPPWTRPVDAVAQTVVRAVVGARRVRGRRGGGGGGGEGSGARRRRRGRGMTAEDVASAHAAAVGEGGEAEGHRRGRGHGTTAVVPASTRSHGTAGRLRGASLGRRRGVSADEATGRPPRSSPLSTWPRGTAVGGIAPNGLGGWMAGLRSRKRRREACLQLLQGSFCSAVTWPRSLFASVDAVDIHTSSCTPLVQLGSVLSVPNHSGHTICPLLARQSRAPHFATAY